MPQNFPSYTGVAGPNARSSLNPTYPSTFQAVDANNVYALASDGALWLEHAPNTGWYGGPIPPKRELVDQNVRAFSAIDADNVYVLGLDDNLWLEHSVKGKFGSKIAPPREQVDANVSAFTPINTREIYILGNDGNLWLVEAGSTGLFQLPPKRTPIASDVKSFVPVPKAPLFSAYVLDRDDNLWCQHFASPAGLPLLPRQQVDANVAAFQPVDEFNIYVLGKDGQLWSEHAAAGQWSQVPPHRDKVDSDVSAFQAFDETTVVVLRSDGQLRIEGSVLGVGVGDFQFLVPPGDGPRMEYYSLLSPAGILESLFHTAGGTLQFGPISQVRHNQKFGANPPETDVAQVDGNVKLPVAYGTVVPKYLIATLIYAPPGTAAPIPAGFEAPYVSYAEGSITGVTTSVSSSFTANVQASVSVDTGLYSANAQFQASTTTANSNWAQVQKLKSKTLKLPGPTTEDGINHDHDRVYIFLNPTLGVTTAAPPNKSVNMELGLGDADSAPLYVEVGQLRNPPTISRNAPNGDLYSQFRDMFNAGLTESDFSQILDQNPFWSGATAIDPKRFTLVDSYSLEAGSGMQQDTETLHNSNASLNTHSTSSSYDVSASGSAGVPGIDGVSVSTSLSWKNQATSTTFQSEAQNAAFNLCEPSANWTGGYEVNVYWDRIYSSFMFAYK